MPRYLPALLLVAGLAGLALLRLREPAAPAPAAETPAATPPPTREPAPPPAATGELPGGLVERAQALLTGRHPPRPGQTTAAAGSAPGTLLVTGHAAPGVDPVDAWRRPLHELRELFTRLPGLVAVEYALQVGPDRKATLRLDRAAVERMRLVQQLDEMHGRREHLLLERSAGKLDEAGYARQLRELERATFSDLLVMIPAADRDIAPALKL